MTGGWVSILTPTCHLARSCPKETCASGTGKGKGHILPWRHRPRCRRCWWCWRHRCGKHRCGKRWSCGPKEAEEKEGSSVVVPEVDSKADPVVVPQVGVPSGRRKEFAKQLLWRSLQKKRGSRCRRWCRGGRRWCRGCRRWRRLPPLLFRLLHLWRWRLRLWPLRLWPLRLRPLRLWPRWLWRPLKG